MSGQVTSTSPAIYVDLDDVLCETARGFLRLLSNEFGRRVEFDAIVSYDLAVSFELTAAEIELFMRRAHREDVLMELAPMPGAVEALAGWRKCGYRLEIATGRPPMTEAVSRAWLERHEVPYDELTFFEKYAHSIASESGRRPKPMTDLTAEDYCLAIEDSRSVAHFLAEAIGLEVVLFDRPWNRNGVEPLPPTVTRSHDWAELGRRFPRP